MGARRREALRTPVGHWRVELVVRLFVAALIGILVLGLAASAWAGGVPVQIAGEGRFVWAASDSGLRVVDERSGAILSAPKSTYPYATRVVAGGGAVWIASITNGYLAGAVDRVDLATKRRTTPIRSARFAVYAIAFGGGTLWAWLASAQQSQSSLIEPVDAAGGRLQTLRLRGRPGWMAATTAGLWLTEGNGLMFIDRRTLKISRIGGIAASAPLAAGLGSIWVPERAQIVRVDEQTRRVVERIRMNPSPLLLATDDRCLWAVVSANLSRGSRLLCYDPEHHTVSRSRHLVFVPSDLALIRGELWLGSGGFPQRLIELDPRTLQTRRRIRLTP
jgi:ligand-binding sensor domain-containing protein